MPDSLQVLKTATIDGETCQFHGFDALARRFDLARLPFAAKLLLENLLRHLDSGFVDQADVDAVARWDTGDHTAVEIAFVPSRVILQDFTGVPAVVDLAAMRDAMVALGGDPGAINPLSPVELVIDHSIMVDVYGRHDALEKNTALEIGRNSERYQFLRWGQQAFDDFRVVPPGRGIVHQVNLEYLARVVFAREQAQGTLLYPDTLVGTDSHTTMINGLGVLGWGVGGIEAEAAMLGQPVTMLIPEVVGFELTGRLRPGATATDLVLTVTEQLRQFGVVGKFVEFCGEGVDQLPLADRATIANMAPEYGATCGLFPVDDKTLDYLRLTGRDPHHIARVEAYYKAMGMWGTAAQRTAVYHARLTLDLGDVVPSLAGPRRPQDRVPLDGAGGAFRRWLHQQQAAVIATTEADQRRFENEGGDTAVGQPGGAGSVPCEYRDERFELRHGAVVIAAITSCTNTSNPPLLLTAGLLARNARRRGLQVQPWVKTSFAPGSQVVTDYLKRSGLDADLDALGFQLVGYGCTTCIGNSGPLPEPISTAIRSGRLNVVSVLSGNRNFEGRIHAEVRANYLASPPLVVAYAIAGNMELDLVREPLGTDCDGQPVTLAELWPTTDEVERLAAEVIDSTMFTARYADVYEGNADWQSLPLVAGKRFAWPDSTYVRKPPFFDGMTMAVPPPRPIQGARCLLLLGDSVTTDHISPAGAIAPDSPAAQYLQQQGVAPADFNSYGSRRGNHEVMMRGTFANLRLKNRLAPGTEGCWTTLFPEGRRTTVFDAAMAYLQRGTPTVVIAGEEYGTGSSRDWAAKGPALLGVRAVIAQSFERIHRSNLVGMGILPLEFMGGEDAVSLGLVGDEEFAVPAIDVGQREVQVIASGAGGKVVYFAARVRVDTPNEFNYYRHGGILQYVLRKLAARKTSA